jgi:N-acetylated-alpha-linked acidic dipeptidase
MENDFDHILNLNINASGNMVMCRYGKIFRGNKVQIAQAYGATGVLLFEDPTLTDSKFIYPNGEFLPGDGTQRGTLASRKISERL